MSDIFISYASQDRPRAQVLAEALLRQGWSVWWDRTIPSGKRFDQVIQEALAAARCIVVVWSQQSVTSDWVLEEAEEGRKRQILIPVFIEDVPPPLGFRRIQGADLIGWGGEGTSPAFQGLIADITGILGPLPIAAQEERRRAEADALRRSEEERPREAADTKGSFQAGRPIRLESRLQEEELSERQVVHASPTVRGRKLPPRILGAFIGAILGAPIGWVTIAQAGASDAGVATLITGLGGAIAGAITGTERRAIQMAFAGIIVIGVLWWFIDYDPPDGIIRAIVLGGPIGAILGSIVSVIAKRRAYS